MNKYSMITLALIGPASALVILYLALSGVMTGGAFRLGNELSRFVEGIMSDPAPFAIIIVSCSLLILIAMLVLRKPKRKKASSQSVVLSIARKEKNQEALDELSERVGKLRRGVVICESFGIDVSKIRQDYESFSRLPNVDARKDAINNAEMNLKIALKKTMPKLVLAAEERVRLLAQTGSDSKNLTDVIKTIEDCFAVGDYFAIIDKLELLHSALIVHFILPSSLLAPELFAEPVEENAPRPLKLPVAKPMGESRPLIHGQPQDAPVEKVKNRLVFLDSRIYVILEPTAKMSQKILLGITAEGHKTRWLTRHAPATIKEYNVPPYIKVRELNHNSNLSEAILLEITELSRSSKKFAVLVDCMVNVMTTEGMQTTVQLIKTMRTRIAGKGACVILPVNPTFLTEPMIIELKKAATIVGNPEEHVNWLESPDRSVSNVLKCSICMGNVKPGNPATICSCGKTFHESCMERIGECPACQKKF